MESARGAHCLRGWASARGDLRGDRAPHTLGEVIYNCETLPGQQAFILLLTEERDGLWQQTQVQSWVPALFSCGNLGNHLSSSLNSYTCKWRENLSCRVVGKIQWNNIRKASYPSPGPQKDPISVELSEATVSSTSPSLQATDMSGLLTLKALSLLPWKMTIFRDAGWQIKVFGGNIRYQNFLEKWQIPGLEQ